MMSYLNLYDSTKMNFTNKELDRDLELNYFGARYYQPEFPRFLSPDPVGGTPEVPISWNRYLYCRNDPVNYFDPDGENPVSDFLLEKCVDIVVGAAKTYAIAVESRELGKDKGWPYAHIYASAKIKQDVGLIPAAYAGYAKEWVDLAKGTLMKDEGSLYSAFQPQDFIMNVKGLKIPDGVDPADWADMIVALENITEGEPGLFYNLLLPFIQASQDVVTQEDPNEVPEDE